MNRSTRLVTMLLCVVAPLVPLRAEDTLLLVGAEGSAADFYTYAGAIVPGPGRKDGRGWFQRYWGERFGYEYENGGQTVEARVWGAEVALGYGIPTGGGWRSVSLGLRHTDTELEPDDRGASARGSQFSAKLQLEGETEFRPGWRIGAIGSYTFVQQQYWGRVRVTRRLIEQLSVGFEAVANGNDESRSVAGGLLLTLQPAGASWSAGFKAGYREQDDSGGAYGGLELSRAL
ncbi:MAG: cellulose biosynthesis protein BcsS [Pseudomonadales bacterium]|nr:cellulose biosynthesis protein BcsS [Pseudomonadales bacterium]